MNSRVHVKEMALNASARTFQGYYPLIFSAFLAIFGLYVLQPLPYYS